MAVGCDLLPPVPGDNGADTAFSETPSARGAAADASTSVSERSGYDAQRAFDSRYRLALPWLTGGSAAAGASEDGPPAHSISALSTTLAIGSQAALGTASTAACPGLAVRSGADLAIDGQPFFFFGVNAHYLVDKEYPETDIEPLLAGLSERGVNTVRLFYFEYHDPDRLARLLDAGKRHGIRFVVTLADDVFRGIDWFINEREQEKYARHLDDTVRRFKDRPEVLLWELVNEPNCGDGRYDDDCLKTIRGWLGEMASRVTAIDPCRVVSTGMIGDGNFESEEKSFRMVNRKEGIGIVSVHRRDTEEAGGELEFANDEERPIFYGEIYDEAYDEGCQPLEGDRSPKARAERIKADLRQAIDDGVDGYLLWDFAVTGFCSKFGFEMEDPLWGKLGGAEDLPPSVPWRR